MTAGKDLRASRRRARDLVTKSAELVLLLTVLLVAELWVVVAHPKLYRRSVRRAWSFGRFPFHAFPRSADEKFLWRKVFDRNPLFVRLSDKIELRSWLAETGLNVKMTPILWAGHSANAMPPELFHGDVMIKTNHASGVNFAMWDGKHAKEDVLRQLSRSLENDYSQFRGEWGYKNVVPRVFAEKRIGKEGGVLNDLKIYTFGRRIERVVHIQNRDEGRFGQVFEPDGKNGFVRLERAPSVCDGVSEDKLEHVFDRALRLARNIGEPFDHMRVDLIEAEGELWMTEMTIYNLSGYITEGGAFPSNQICQAWDLRRSWVMRTMSGGIPKRIYLGLLKRSLDRTARRLPDLLPA